MEEKYKGYTIKYNEERAIFEANNGEHQYSHTQLKELRTKIDRQAAHDGGFKKFETWYLDGTRLRRVRVTSVNKEEPHFDGYGPGERATIYRVRITYLDKVEDNSWQRNEVDHPNLLSTDEKSQKMAAELIILIRERDGLTKRIEEMGTKIPHIKPGDLGIKEEK